MVESVRELDLRVRHLDEATESWRGYERGNERGKEMASKCAKLYGISLVDTLAVLVYCKTWLSGDEIIGRVRKPAPNCALLLD